MLCQYLSGRDAMRQQEYYTLKENGNIGFYDYCDAITIYLHCKRDKKNYNFFTLVTFREGNLMQDGIEKITPKLITISGEISLGIIKYSFVLSEADNRFENLKSNNNWKINTDELILDPLILLTKKIVPISGNFLGFDAPFPINNIFNNYQEDFLNNAYFIEFFAIKDNSSITELLTLEELKKVYHAVYNSKLGFNFNYLNDRVGNIIFKFGCSIFSGTPNQLGKDNGTEIEFKHRNGNNQSRKYILQKIQEFDELITNYDLVENFDGGIVRIEPNDKLNKIIIIDIETKLIVFAYVVDYRYKNDYRDSIKPASFFTSADINFRTVLLGEKESKIPLSTIDPLGSDKYWVDTMAALVREYSKSKEELFSNKSICMYHKDQKNDAINDIRWIINNKRLKWDTDEICLWDPYLTAEDILNTVYYCDSSQIKIRAITSKKSKEASKGSEEEQPSTSGTESIADWMTKQKEKLKTGSNNYGINLEFKCRHSEYGWAFHDRFLIIKHKVNYPRVWSLGTSINTIGKNHHIIQIVESPIIIVEAFDELWDSLPAAECTICKIGTD
jgi:hypothetical protein